MLLLSAMAQVTLLVAVLVTQVSCDVILNESAHHDVAPRSDDKRLEVVVSEMNQRVTQMSAEIQALKNAETSHTSDIQKCLSDIHNLKTSYASDFQKCASDIQKVNDTHTFQILLLNASHTSDMRDLKASYSADVQQLNASHATDIQDLKAWQSAEIQKLKASHASEMQALKQQQAQHVLDSRSTSFVHWGSSHCPHHSSLVYSGVVGGTSSKLSGAAVNYLCLTMHPVFGHAKSFQESAFLYGGEYETGDSHDDMDAVCAVCLASFSTFVMIPGTNVCTPGWTTLYSGYLMAGEAEHHTSASEYVCVDAAMEDRPGTSYNYVAKQFYFTKTRCGSLPCGPYAADKVVTCVVCGK